MLDSRQILINSAVECLKTVAIRHGYGSISEQTLAMIIETYKVKYNPPKLPVGRAKINDLDALIKAIEQPRPANVVYLDTKRGLK